MQTICMETRTFLSAVINTVKSRSMLFILFILQYTDRLFGYLNSVLKSAFDLVAASKSDWKK